MKKGKILSLLVATSIAAGTFAGVQVPKITYAQDMQQDENNIDSNNDDNSNTGDEAQTEETDKVEVISLDSSENVSDTTDVSVESNSSDTTGNTAVVLDNNSSDDVISAISDATSSIDTSQFDNQESFDGTNYDEIDENEISEPSGFYSFFTSRVSENYYDFNISGAQKYTYGTSGKGRPLYYYKVGSGDKVLMLNFGIHGYEDAWAKDGEELTKLAKNLIERLAKDNSSGGLNGWTVVIVPTSNPDGVLDGSTNNGPGRCQISQKIDLNRSFPTFFTPQYSSRYYTGSTALAAPEAKALASLVDQYSSSSSHMALVDVHGWLNETIGDPSLGQAFDSSFGISNKLMSTAAQGYLISYAHSKGALVSLLELPMPSSQSSITNNGYANKIYNGVKSIVNNGDGFTTMNAQGEVVNTNSLNIRITTSTNSNIIGTYSKGTKITILGKVGNWYQVKSSNGYGYVSADYIKVLSNNTNSGSNNGGSVEAPTTYQTGKVSNISTSLNVRKSASTSSTVVTKLTNGTEVKVVGIEGSWYKIYSESFGYGYVSKSYITIISSGNNNGGNNQGSTTPEAPSTPEVPSTPENIQTGQVINVTSKLNIRGGAGTNYGIVGTLDANATVNILGQEGSWYKISYNGVTGYVSSSYIKINSSGNNTNTDSTVKYGKVVNISTKLNVRKSASTSASTVGTLVNSTKVTILEKLNGWYKISYNGIVGYVSSSYIAEI